LPIANRAEAELARLGLTPREIEVLAVVADGRTNRQIAEILFIAEKTAAIHVSHILGKLGAANRVEAAATAYRLGLSAHSADRLSS
jgi:DNA-binding CsgD family transcriptional regulator